MFIQSKVICVCVRVRVYVCECVRVRGSSGYSDVLATVMCVRARLCLTCVCVCVCMVVEVARREDSNIIDVPHNIRRVVVNERGQM